METARFPKWDAPPITLRRVDPNILNFIRRDYIWLSVDWENAGWGDAAKPLTRHWIDIVP